MMTNRYSQIVDGRVVNQILADSEFATALGLVPAADSRIGDLWDGEHFSAAPDPGLPEPVPASVSRRQGQLVLLSYGLLDDAEAAIAAITDDMQRRAAQIEYGADTWERSNAFLSQLWAQLGGTSESLDEAFRTAVTL